jgi:hypothetical protein
MTTEQAREFSEQVVAEHFGRHSNSAKAFELSKDGPKYSRMKRQAVLDKLIAPPPVWADPDYRKRFDPVQLPEETLRLLADAKLCEDAVTYYGGGQSSGGTDTVSKLATERPDYYKRVRACAIAKGFIEDRPAQPAPKPKPVNEFTVVPDEVCDAAGLPHGYQTTASGLASIQRIIKEVAEVKATADAQAKRDAANDSSVATFGHVRETPADAPALIAAGMQKYAGDGKIRS